MNNQDVIRLEQGVAPLLGGIPEPIGKSASAFHRYMQVYISRSLVNGQFGIGPGQLYVLMVISRNPGICQKEIAQQLMIEKATVAKAVKTLVNTGYIRTEADPVDKRQMKVFLSERGRNIMPSILHFLDGMNQIILKDFSRKEITMVYHFLERMNHNLLKKLMDIGDQSNNGDKSK